MTTSGCHGTVYCWLAAPVLGMDGMWVTSQVVPQSWDFSCWTSQLTSLSAAGSFIGTVWRLAVAEGVWPVPLIWCYHMSDGSSSTDRQSQVALQSIPFSIFQYHNFMTSEKDMSVHNKSVYRVAWVHALWKVNVWYDWIVVLCTFAQVEWCRKYSACISYVAADLRGV